jgi:hypothetical protein
MVTFSTARFRCVSSAVGGRNASVASTLWESTTKAVAASFTARRATSTERCSSGNTARWAYAIVPIPPRIARPPMHCRSRHTPGPVSLTFLQPSSAQAGWHRCRQGRGEPDAESRLLGDVKTAYPRSDQVLVPVTGRSVR